MKCLSCGSYTFDLICTKCQHTLLSPSFYTRKLDGLDVYSFYGYEEIEKLIFAKYEFYGDKVFKVLAKLSFLEFAKNFCYDSKIAVIPIDDHTRHGFSHTAILAKTLQSDVLIPQYASLRGQNQISYAGKDLEFRRNNPRNFLYSGKKNIQVVLVDDIITTGTTIAEAREVLAKNGCEVLFGLCLADASL